MVFILGTDDQDVFFRQHVGSKEMPRTYLEPVDATMTSVDGRPSFPPADVFPDFGHSQLQRRDETSELLHFWCVNLDACGVVTLLETFDQIVSDFNVDSPTGNRKPFYVKRLTCGMFWGILKAVAIATAPSSNGQDWPKTLRPSHKSYFSSTTSTPLRRTWTCTTVPFPIISVMSAFAETTTSAPL